MMPKKRRKKLRGPWPIDVVQEAEIFQRLDRLERETRQLHRAVRDLSSVLLGTEGAAIGELAPRDKAA